MSGIAEQEEAIRNYRAAIEKNIADEEAFGRYAQRRDRNEPELERLREQKNRSDQNEDAAKARYEELNCESNSGLSADGFRHQVTEEYTQREMEALREKKREEIAAQMQNENSNANHM